MAVPKKRTSKSRRDMRRSHHGIKSVNVIIDKETGEYRLPHHICSIEKTYNGKKILKDKA